MIYETGEMRLKSIRDVLHGTVNDVIICRDLNAQDNTYYTMLIVKDHTVAKLLLEIFRQAKHAQTNAFITSFSDNGNFCLLFDYEKERPLMEFYMGDVRSLNASEKICIGIIMECISIQLPFPFLYLLLEQNQLHIEKDCRIYFNYFVDLSQLDIEKGERECAVKCAEILQKLLEPHAPNKAISYQLLQKKIPKSGYMHFTELYRDIKMAAVPDEKAGFFSKLKAFWRRNKDLFFKILLVSCILLGVITVLMILSQLIFGDIAFLRLLFNPFKVIGTENLVQ